MISSCCKCTHFHNFSKACEHFVTVSCWQLWRTKWLPEMFLPFFLCSHVHLCADCIYQIDFRNTSVGHELMVIRWFRALRHWEPLLEILSRSNVPLTAFLRIQESSVRRETLWFWYLCTAWASRRAAYSFWKPGRSDEQNGGD